MKKILFMLLFIASAQAKDANVDSSDDSTFLQGMVAGHYELIGKSIGSKNTYFGEIIIDSSESELKVTRIINGNTVIGKAAIEKTGEMVNVLRIRFTENEVNYEETCLVNSDLDNYARLTCHLYEPSVTKTDPGLEAMFIKQIE